MSVFEFESFFVDVIMVWICDVVVVAAVVIVVREVTVGEVIW